MVLLPEETAVMPRPSLVFEIPDTFTEPLSVLMVLLPKMVADMPYPLPLAAATTYPASPRRKCRFSR